MGAEPRRRRTAGGRLEYPTPATAAALDDAVQRILARVRATGAGGVFDSTGHYHGPTDQPDLVVRLGPKGVRRTDTTSGALIAVEAGEDAEDVRDRMYWAHGMATERLGQQQWVEQVLYAAIGIGHSQPVPTEQVEALAEQVRHDITAGRFDPRLLEHGAAGLREILGLPGGPWTARADEAAERGRQACALVSRPDHGGHPPDVGR